MMDVSSDDEFRITQSSFRSTIVNDDFSLDSLFEDVLVSTLVEKEQFETTESTKKRGITVLEDGECEKRIKERVPVNTRRSTEWCMSVVFGESGEKREILWKSDGI